MTRDVTFPQPGYPYPSIPKTLSRQNIDILYGQNAEILNVPKVGTCSEHGASQLKWNKSVFRASRTQVGNLLQFNYSE
jgi:hypothetical protein